MEYELISTWFFPCQVKAFMGVVVSAYLAISISGLETLVVTVASPRPTTFSMRFAAAFIAIFAD